MALVQDGGGGQMAREASKCQYFEWGLNLGLAHLRIYATWEAPARIKGWIGLELG